MFLALETGKGTPRALRKERKERIGEKEREKERKLRIDGERTDRQVEVISGAYTLKFTTTPLTDRNLCRTRFSTWLQPECRHFGTPLPRVSFRQCPGLIRRKNRADILELWIGI